MENLLQNGFVVVTLFHLYLIYIWLSFFLENLNSMIV